MDSYHVSKAWHLGHHLAVDVHSLAKSIPKDDPYNLAVQMRKASALAPLKIEESIKLEFHKEKLRCYKIARRAVTEIQEHLTLARDRSYITQQQFKDLINKAIEAYHTLSKLIRSTKQQLALSEQGDLWR